jgi:hypothetical protein
MNMLSLVAASDRAKIEILPKLIDLSINQNPLGQIPPFINTKIQFLSLQDTSLTSATFPSTYANSSLQRISLSDNKIRSIDAQDFLVLRNSKLNRLHIDSASISTIDQNAFTSLPLLQALSLKNNQLTSCKFLPNLPLLSSIHLDQNQFTSLPDELSSPAKIKMYSFIHNSISVIDEASPLYKWAKMNRTDITIYLANNSFDCCLSIWFIRFLKTSRQFVADASSLKCATPSNFAGKSLIQLNPDEMNCGGGVPSKSWWTTGRIIGVIIGCVVTISIILIITVAVFNRQHPSRSGYMPIGENDDTTYNTNATLSGGLVFSVPDEDDDGYSTITDFSSSRTNPRSEAPTNSTGAGTYAADGSQAGGSDIQEAALLPH